METTNLIAKKSIAGAMLFVYLLEMEELRFSEDNSLSLFGGRVVDENSDFVVLFFGSEAERVERIFSSSSVVLRSSPFLL